MPSGFRTVRSGGGNGLSDMLTGIAADGTVLAVPAGNSLTLLESSAGAPRYPGRAEHQVLSFPELQLRMESSTRGGAPVGSRGSGTRRCLGEGRPRVRRRGARGLAIQVRVRCSAAGPVGLTIIYRGRSPHSRRATYALITRAERELPSGVSHINLTLRGAALRRLKNLGARRVYVHLTPSTTPGGSVPVNLEGRQ